MIFFTDVQTTNSNYCLLNIKKYHLIPKLNKQIYFIDPSVLELKTNIEFSKIDLLHKIASSKPKYNEYITIDYPCDMNIKYSDLFIKKSIENNLKYKNNSHYICTIQSKFMNTTDFIYQFDYLKDKINFSNKIIGIGNTCRILKVNKKTLPFLSIIKEKLINEIKEINWIHFFGLAYQVIDYLIKDLHKSNNKCIISMDSTKWTQAVDYHLKWMYGFQCKKSNRNLYFLYYVHKIMRNHQLPIIY